MAAPALHGLLASDNRMTSKSSTAKPVPQLSSIPFQLKRTTCDLCRERKVRCDRGKPECRRCKRTGQTCTYPSPGGEAAKLNSTLQDLYSRLIQAETKLREQGILVPADSSGSESHSRFISSPHGLPPLPSDIDLGDISADFGSWEQSMYFDSMGSLVEEAPPEDNGLQRDSPPLSDAGAVLSSHSPLAMWTANTLSTGQPAAHLPSSGVGDGVSQISSVIMKRLFQTHFDLVQKHLQLIDRNDFLQFTTSIDTHQNQALKYAVCMSGASASEDLRHLEQQCYVAARCHLDKAEMRTDNSSFLNLETAQALILVARFEFTQTNAPTALITTARLIRLLSLLGYDRLDSSAAGGDRDGSRAPSPLLTHSPTKLQEMRRTFWIAFSMHCHAAANTAGYGPIEIDEIHTALPSKLAATERDQRIFITNAVTQSATENLEPFSLFVLAMRLVACTDQHHRMTTANVAGTGAPDYNFCLAHERIEIMIGAILSSSSSSALLTGPDTELRVLTLVIALGARIALYKTAIVNVQKAAFLGPVVGESQKMGVSAATAMCDVLLQADVLNADQAPVYKAMSLFIMRPLALAAEIQLCVLRSGVQGIGLIDWMYSNREIRHSLDVICRAMDAFKDSTGQHEPCIKECRAFLGSTQLSNRFSTEFRVPPRPHTSVPEETSSVA